MNQRIQELYRQAHTIRHYDGDPMREGNPPTVYWQNEVSAQKFAELIVEECANVADENYIHRGSRTCGLAIRLHFGVEE